VCVLYVRLNPEITSSDLKNMFVESVPRDWTIIYLMDKLNLMDEFKISVERKDWTLRDSEVCWDFTACEF